MPKRSNIAALLCERSAPVYDDALKAQGWRTLVDIAADMRSSDPSRVWSREGLRSAMNRLVTEGLAERIYVRNPEAAKRCTAYRTVET